MILHKMDVDELLKLRSSVEIELQKRSDTLRQQLTALDQDADVKPTVRGDDRRAMRFGKRSLKGSKVKPKYRGPNGETWAGRGMKPRWMTTLLKQGRKLESFAV